MKKHRRGFTLVEILLVSAMFALISLAVFNAFSNGFKLWARGQHVMLEGDIAIFMDRLGQDLRQTVTISGIPFKGNSTDIAFPAIIRAPADANSSRAAEGVVRQIGAVRYRFDPGEKKIYRYQAVYGQALKGEWSDPVQVAGLIEDITVRYYFKTGKAVEVKEMTDQGLPMGLMVDVEYLVDGQPMHMRRFFVIPVGGGL
ncbi:MAG: prepilin-type N-terminal cleavage/methylation domain-containing protein [Candidatus Omnitrophica bacterium]|nr:prepilin-type N-terminal cleavage/methylation domain-containing protein [Candidatus Omnitrophota bacterium]